MSDDRRQDRRSVVEFCHALGLNPAHVTELRVWPDHVEADLHIPLEPVTTEEDKT